MPGQGGRGGALAVLIVGTALVAATLVQPAGAAARRWLLEPALAAEARGLAGGVPGARPGAASAPCELPDWHPRIDCNEWRGLAAHGLRLPPGHPPIGGDGEEAGDEDEDGHPALPPGHPRVLHLPPGHPPVDGFPGGDEDEGRPIPLPAAPALGPQAQSPQWI